MAPQAHPVLVVGAGPTGLIAALTLRHNGIPVRIIEKADKPFTGSRALGTHPRTFEVYKFLGVLPDILRLGTPVPDNRIYKCPPEGTELAKELKNLGRGYPTPGMPFYNMWVLGQDVTQRVLRTHLEKHGVRVEFGTELRAFAQHADRVEAHIVKPGEGTNGAEETFTASYLVGADGARGVVRKALGLQFAGVTREDATAVLGDVRVRGVSRDHWNRWMKGNVPALSLLPRYTHDPDVFGIIAFGLDATRDYARFVEDTDAFKQYVREVTGRPEIEITEFLGLSYVKFNIRMVSEFGKGRVFIAGDAAHVHSPTGGQGMNSSIMDAFNLAWKLTLAHKNLAAPGLLASYTAERQPVIKNMLTMTTEVLDKALANKEGAWERGARFFQLDVHYRGSAITLEDDPEREGAPDPPVNVYTFGTMGRVRAGDRAPDAPHLLDLRKGSVGTLFDVLTPAKHTVLVFTQGNSAADNVLGALRAYPAAHVQSVVIMPAFASVREDAELPGAGWVLKDADRHAYEGYSVDHATTGHEAVVVVVRPDGFVGAIGRGAGSVQAYFAKILC